MAFFAVYAAKTGQILRTGSCPQTHVSAQAGEGEVAIEAGPEIRDDTHFWRDGVFFAYPARPSPIHSFDFASGDWIDARSAEQVAVDLAAAQKSANERIVQEIDSVTLRITGAVPAAEMLAWASKEAAARAFLAGATSEEQDVILKGEALQTGEEISGLAVRIIANADSYRAIIATLTGVRRKAAAVIAVLEAEAEIEAVVQETLRALASDGVPG
jgi:hypothetical protein